MFHRSRLPALASLAYEAPGRSLTLVEGDATLNTTLTLAAGGALTVGGDFTQDATSTLRIELGDVNHDAIDVTGHLTLGGTLQIVAWDDFDPVSGDSFQLFTFDTIGGAFSEIDAFTLGAGLAWDFSRLETEGWISVTAVPEPAAFAALASLGALGLAATRRRRA